MDKVAYSLAISLALASAGAIADTTTVSGGTINFEGKVVNAACSVAADSVNQTITLDDVKVSKLATSGEAAGQPVPFQIVIADCDTTVMQNVSVSFNGQSDVSSTGALANTAGAGAATNVALQLYGPDGQTLALGVESSTVPLIGEQNTVPFSVDYIATSDAATAGTVAATATFSMNYS
ncbi:fimbrial protein [Rahnella woolbedingensis]|uniref:fimbrial protein n=1 Tax=Rahnella woolbedingensis TaxID=1510574 RepID=UPI003CC5FD6C